jgi:Ca-activated chloride channel family protein
MENAMRRVLTAFTVVTATFLMTTGSSSVRALSTGPQRPTFSAAARMVLVSVSVRDNRGRPVTGLTREDFQIFSDDAAHPIEQFRSESSAITTALLMDQSGSMQVAANLDAAREAARLLVSWMTPLSDRLGFFTFDTALTQTGAFAPVSGSSLLPMAQLDPYGETSLYDAVDATSAALMTDAAPRRAVVAITDGLDNASLLTAAEVSGRAAIIDVPVYIVAVVSPVDHPDSGVANARPQTPLSQLAEATGGQLFVSSAPAHASVATRTIISDLRQQYLLAFTADPRPGWHRLTVRTRHHHQTVRTRAGYVTR